MCCTNAEEMQGNPPSLLNAHLETHSRRNLKQRSAIFRKLLEKQQKRRFFGIFFHFSLKEILENLKGLYQTSFKTILKNVVAASIKILHLTHLEGIKNGSLAPKKLVFKVH